MQVLYIGDIMGAPGIAAVRQSLPEVRKEHQIDLVIAQAENVTEGKGMSKTDFQTVRSLGIDFCTGGNWSLFRPELHDYLADPQQPVIRPANYPPETPGLGAKFVTTKLGRVLIISLLGHIVGKDADKPMQNTLKCVDEIREANASVEKEVHC